MKIDLNSHRYVSKVVSITLSSNIGSRAKCNSFYPAIDKVVERGKIEPYLYHGKFVPRIPNGGFTTFEADPIDGIEVVPLTRSYVGLAKYLIALTDKTWQSEVANAVFLLDGGAFGSSVLAMCQSHERVFAMFPPYDPMHTIPLTEIKRQHEISSSVKSYGVDRVEI